VTELLSTAASVANALIQVLLLVSSVTLAVSGIGITNIMLADGVCGSAKSASARRWCGFPVGDICWSTHLVRATRFALAVAVDQNNPGQGWTPGQLSEMSNSHSEQQSAFLPKTPSMQTCTMRDNRLCQRLRCLIGNHPKKPMLMIGFCIIQNVVPFFGI
jgi:hypothetical protein